MLIDFERNAPVAQDLEQLIPRRSATYAAALRCDADDPLPGMNQSLAYLRGVLGGLAVRS